MKPHTTDAVSLTFGLVFLGIAGLWSANQVASLSPATTSAVAAGSLIVLGLLGIALAWRSTPRGDGDSPRPGPTGPGDAANPGVASTPTSGGDPGHVPGPTP